MKHLILCTLLGLSACQSTTEPTPEQNNNLPYLDLTAVKGDRPERQYWQESKRTYPGYPIAAAADRRSGCVQLEFGINTQGHPEGYRIIKSYPQGIFDQKAADALAQWRWKPATNESQSQPVFTRIQMDFMVSGARNIAEAEENCGYQHH